MCSELVVSDFMGQKKGNRACQNRYTLVFYPAYSLPGYEIFVTYKLYDFITWQVYDKAYRKEPYFCMV